MMKRIVLLGALGLSLSLMGCLSSAPVTKSDYGKYVPAPDLVDADVMPSDAELKNQPIKVVVFEADESGSQVAKASQAGVAMSKAIESIIAGRSIEVVNQGAATKLRDALKVSGASGKSIYTGAKIADYAIYPVINSAELIFNNNQAVNEKKQNGIQNYQAVYYHVGRVTATVKVYEIPSLRLLKVLSVDGRNAIETQSPQVNAASAAGLVRNASVAAIQDDKSDILNIFAGKGFIESKKISDKQSIFKVTMGSEQGVKPGDKIAIYSRRPGDKSLSGKSSFEEVLVAISTVTENVSEKYVWVQPDDEEKGKSIRRGDVARLEHQKGLLGDIKSKMKGKD